MEQKTIKDNKIAFILCVNNQMYFDECCAYLDRLSVPDGYEVEVLPVWDSSSMCQAYNIGMNASDAKYKIYMHQDVFITEELFIQKIVRIFENNKDIGMIGMVGAEHIPSSGVFFNSYDVGKVEVREPDMPYYYVAGKDKEELMDVQAVDGVLMATQVDIPWREDLFKDYDFYDASQGLEFIKAGYRVVVPAQEKPWIIHDCGFAKLDKYDRSRRIFTENYSRYLTYDGGMSFEYNGEWDELSSQLAEIVKNDIELGKWAEVEKIIRTYSLNNYKNTELEKQRVLYEIYKIEEQENINAEQRFFAEKMTYSQIADKYNCTRFAMRRYELGWTDDCTIGYENEIINGEVSMPSVFAMLPYAVLYRNDFLLRLYSIENKGAVIEYNNELKQLLNMDNIGKINIAYGRRYK